MEMEQLLQTISERLHYNPETGIFTWKVSRGGKAKAGKKAGCITTDGYVQIYINNKPYYAHQLAYLISYRKQPTLSIDHINRNKSDNRLCNLRLANQKLNTLNNKAKGTCKTPWGWSAGITVDGVRKHLGYYDSQEEAHAVYYAVKTVKIQELERNLNGTTIDS
jgi:hypothetical protein